MQHQADKSAFAQQQQYGSAIQQEAYNLHTPTKGYKEIEHLPSFNNTGIKTKDLKRKLRVTKNDTYDSSVSKSHGFNSTGQALAMAQTGISYNAAYTSGQEDPINTTQPRSSVITGDANDTFISQNPRAQNGSMDEMPSLKIPKTKKLSQPYNDEIDSEAEIMVASDPNGPYNFLSESQQNDIDRILQAPHYDRETKQAMIMQIKQQGPSGGMRPLKTAGNNRYDNQIGDNGPIGQNELFDKMRNRAGRKTGNKRVKNSFGPYNGAPKERMLLDDYNMGLKQQPAEMRSLQVKQRGGTAHSTAHDSEAYETAQPETRQSMQAKLMKRLKTNQKNPLTISADPRRQSYQQSQRTGDQTSDASSTLGPLQQRSHRRRPQNIIEASDELKGPFTPNKLRNSVHLANIDESSKTPQIQMGHRKLPFNTLQKPDATVKSNDTRQQFQAPPPVQAVNPLNYEWDQNGRKYLKGQRPDAIKVSKLLASVGDDDIARRRSKNFNTLSVPVANQSTPGPETNRTDPEEENDVVHSYRNPIPPKFMKHKMVPNSQTLKLMREKNGQPKREATSPDSNRSGQSKKEKKLIEPIDPEIFAQRLYERHGQNLLFEQDYVSGEGPPPPRQKSQGSQTRGSPQNQKSQALYNAGMPQYPNRTPYAPGRQSPQSRRSSQNSVSPTRNLMHSLTQGGARVSEHTVLLINQTESLSKEGIKGRIAPIGIGFGTARHTSQRKSANKIPTMKRATPLDRMRSPMAKSHCSQASIGVSARTQTPVRRFNAAASAMEMDQKSLRSKHEQVSQGRFEPYKFDAQGQTESGLLKNYKKPVTTNADMATEPVIIVERKIQAVNQIQTDPDPDDRPPLMPPPPLKLVQEHMITMDQEVQAPPPIDNIGAAFDHESSEEDNYDWVDSHIYVHIVNTHSKLLARRGVLEKAPGTPKSQQGMSLPDKDLYNLNPMKLPILSYNDCRYWAQTMRDIMFEKMGNGIPEHDLEEITEKVKTTIEVLGANLVNPLFMQKVFFNNYRVTTLENCVKLLYRARKLYDARDKVQSILKSIIEIEVATQPGGVFWRILQDQMSKVQPHHKELVDNLLMLIGRTLCLIDSFKEENKIFRDKFIFKENEYTESLFKQVSLISGWYLNKEMPGLSMDLIGQMTFEPKDKEGDLEAYKKWYKESLNKTGKLELPSLEAFNRKQKKKESRIDATLSSIKPVQPSSTPRQPMIRDITPLGSQIGQEETSSQQFSIEHEEPHINQPAWMTGEFDGHGNIIPQPKRQRDKEMTVTKEETELQRRLLNVPSEHSSVAFDLGYTGPKMLGIEPKVIDNNFVPNTAQDIPAGIDVGKWQSKDLIEPLTLEWNGEFTDLKGAERNVSSQMDVQGQDQPKGKRGNGSPGRQKPGMASPGRSEAAKNVNKTATAPSPAKTMKSEFTVAQDAPQKIATEKQGSPKSKHGSPRSKRDSQLGSQAGSQRGSQRSDKQND